MSGTEMREASPSKSRPTSTSPIKSPKIAWEDLEKEKPPPEKPPPEKPPPEKPKHEIETRAEPAKVDEDVVLKHRRLNYRRHTSFDLMGHIDDTPRDEYSPMTPVPNEFKDVPFWTSYRFMYSIIAFFGFVCLYAQRVNLSIAIVTMVDHKYFDELNKNSEGYMKAVNESSECPEPKKIATEGEFRWDKKFQGLILGAFFWGYLVFQVVGGSLSERFGAKRVVAAGMFPVAILNILTPSIVRWNEYVFLFARVLIGMGESVMYPSAQAFWSKWSPPHERSRLIGITYAGGQFGNAIIFPIGGFLCANGFDNGWASVFYVIGMVGFVWCCIWVCFVYDTPAECPKITELERRYIESSLKSKGHRVKGLSTPWFKIMTSLPLWAIMVGHVCANYGAYMLLTQIPTYMKEVLKFDITSNGVYSMLPYLAFWLFIIGAAAVADFLITREIFTVEHTRKIMSGAGLLMPACFLVATGFMTCHQQLEAVAMLTFSVGLCGLQFSGFFVNHGEIAPPYAGTLFGITNTAATVPGIIAPYIVGALTPNGTAEEWQLTFFIAAGVYVFGATFYTVFGTADIQDWAAVNKVMEEIDAGPDTSFGTHPIKEAIQEEEEDA